MKNSLLKSLAVKRVIKLIYLSLSKSF